MKNFAVVITLLLGLAAAMPVQSAELSRVTASDGQANDRFGAAMASTRDYVAISAPRASVEGREEQGAVYIFARVDCTLEEVARLVADDGGAGDRFGTSLAMRGDVLLIGTPNGRGEQPGHGAVYVFTRRGNEWRQTDKLFARNSFPDAAFGASIAMDDERVLVGAPRATTGARRFLAGAAYVFERRRGEWQQMAELTADDAEFAEEFGSGVALNDEIALVGAPGARNSDGNFRLFQRDGDDDDDDGGWEEEERTRASRDSSARLGEHIVKAGDYFAVSARGAETPDTHRSGVVYLYERDGDDLDDVRQLAANDWSTDAAFGSALAMDDNRLVVAAINAGTVHVFDRRDNWQETVALAAPADGESFGSSLALSADLVIVAAPAAEVNGNTGQGVVYVYQLE